MEVVLIESGQDVVDDLSNSESFVNDRIDTITVVLEI